MAAIAVLILVLVLLLASGDKPRTSPRYSRDG